MENNEENPLLELPRSKVKVFFTELMIRALGGETVARHKLDEIQDACLERKVDSVSIFIIIISLSGVVCSKIFIPSQLWGWLTCVLFGLVACFFLMMIYKWQLKLSLKHGEVSYDVVDSYEEAKGFVVSLRSLIDRINKTN